MKLLEYQGKALLARAAFGDPEVDLKLGCQVQKRHAEKASLGGVAHPEEALLPAVFLVCRIFGFDDYIIRCPGCQSERHDAGRGASGR